MPQCWLELTTLCKCLQGKCSDHWLRLLWMDSTDICPFISVEGQLLLCITIFTNHFKPQRVHWSLSMRWGTQRNLSHNDKGQGLSLSKWSADVVHCISHFTKGILFHCSLLDSKEFYYSEIQNRRQSTYPPWPQVKKWRPTAWLNPLVGQMPV